DRLEQEHDNLRAAMHWSLEQVEDRKEFALRLAGALRSFWYSRGYLSEGLDFLERILVQRHGVAAPVAAKAIYAAARLYEARGDYDRAEPLIIESLALNRELEDKTSIADSLFNLARASFFSGDDLARARTLLEESLALFNELGDKESIAYCHCLSGRVALEQGDTTSARSLIEQSV